MRDEKALAPGLYLVATPIGNLEDITLRALRVLRLVDRIACEDTRQTQKLLNHFEIKKPTVSYHLFNEAARTEELIAELKAGARIAVVSDAGTPGIADPGAHIAAAAIAAGVQVFPVPGANALLAGLVGSGVAVETFTFHGFLPAKGGARRSLLEGLGVGTHVFYETPHRIVEALEDVKATFGEGQRVVVARELTKMHEEFLRGTVGEVLSRIHVRGEMVLILPVAAREEKAIASVAEAVARLLGEGLSEKEALKGVAKERGLGKSEVYREWQRGKR